MKTNLKISNLLIIKNIKLIFNQLSIIFFIIVSLYITSCKPDDSEPLHGKEKPPRDTLYCDKEFLPYWYFNKGSMWVYKRTDTNAIMYDTAIVVSAKTDIQFLTSFNSLNALEGRFISILHSDSNFWDRYNKVMYVRCDYLFNKETQFDLNSKKSNLQFSYFSYYDRISDPNYIVTLNKTISMSNYTFNNTIEFKSDKYGIALYLSKNIGISKIIFNNQTWELINYNIIQ